MEIDVCRRHVARCDVVFVCVRLQPVASELVALLAKPEATK